MMHGQKNIKKPSVASSWHFISTY